MIFQLSKTLFHVLVAEMVLLTGFGLLCETVWAKSDELGDRNELVEHVAPTVNQHCDRYSQMLLEYKQLLTRRINRAWCPPRDGGSAVVRFSLSRTGEATDLSIVLSSGYKSCDAAALKAVTAAQPFSVIPEELPAPLIVIFDFRFSFGLKQKGIRLYSPTATNTK